MCSTNRRDLPHSTPFSLKWGWIADYGVDFKVRVPYTIFFFEYILGFAFMKLFLVDRL
jgi:hypothetical protein